jgi:hypothetical protein
LSKDKQAPKELKVTDKRIFTPEGDIREEFKTEIHAADPQQTASAAEAAPPQPPPPQPQPPKREPAPAPPSDSAKQPPRSAQEERRRTMADKATNPNTPFTDFIEPLIAQGYMSLGLLRNPYQPQAKIDVAAARQMIEILTLLQEKTRNNLTAEEDDFLQTHLGELKLAFVQRTKSIG